MANPPWAQTSKHNLLLLGTKSSPPVPNTHWARVPFICSVTVLIKDSKPALKSKAAFLINIFRKHITGFQQSTQVWGSRNDR